MAQDPRAIARGKELAAMSTEDFLNLCNNYRHYSPSEFDALEPFFVVVAMQKLRAL